MSSPSRTIRPLETEPITAESFAPYGEVILPCDVDQTGLTSVASLVFPDNNEDPEDTPLVYLMRLHDRGLVFKNIARHQRVTQCLGVTNESDVWYLGVCEADGSQVGCDVERIRGFRIPGNVIVKLHCGTWHAGPYFERPGAMTFFNLETKKTNARDKDEYEFCDEEGFSLQFIPPLDNIDDSDAV